MSFNFKQKVILKYVDPDKVFTEYKNSLRISEDTIIKSELFSKNLYILFLPFINRTPSRMAIFITSTSNLGFKKFEVIVEIASLN